MATYTNLASLSGLQVGDVINYTTDTAIDLAGKNIRVELYGKVPNRNTAQNAGYVVFDLNSESLTNKNFYYSKSGGSSLCSGSSYNAYYRIGVAGDSGGGKNALAKGGAGGGLTGGTGDNSSSTTYGGYGGTGGSQISGGTGGTGFGRNANNGSNGTFETGGINSSSRTINPGGAGWYGGGAGGYGLHQTDSYYDAGGGGGGSGFVIGQSTSVYPAGYMGNNSSLIAELEAGVSNATLTQGGSSQTSDSMVITILDIPVPSTHECVKVYDSTQQSFVPCEVYYYTSGDFQLCEVYRYDGNEFIKIEV